MACESRGLVSARPILTILAAEANVLARRIRAHYGLHALSPVIHRRVEHSYGMRLQIGVDPQLIAKVPVPGSTVHGALFVRTSSATRAGQALAAITQQSAVPLHSGLGAGQPTLLRTPGEARPCYGPVLRPLRCVERVSHSAGISGTA